MQFILFHLVYFAISSNYWAPDPRVHKLLNRPKRAWRPLASAQLYERSLGLGRRGHQPAVTIPRPMPRFRPLRVTGHYQSNLHLRRWGRFASFLSSSSTFRIYSTAVTHTCLKTLVFVRSLKPQIPSLLTTSHSFRHHAQHLSRIRATTAFKMSDFSLFSLFTAGLALFAPLATAYTQPVGDSPKGNPISQPGLMSIVPAGKPFTVRRPD